MPSFSIVIPTYNRARLIERTLHSCLCQSFLDFEIIVVDDGSTDDTAAVVEQVALQDPRVRLLRHSRNRGACPARNTGADAAEGDWIICLDSDDELVTDALRVMRQRAAEVGSDISGLRFMCRLDNGEISPDPPLKDEVWDYADYIRWMESVIDGRQETLVVVRRQTFATARYPDGREAEAIYHLDFARRFAVRTCPTVVRLYHQDADNQLMRPDPQRSLRAAPDMARGLEAVFDRHGRPLSRWAPRAYSRHVSALATLQFLCGERVKGLRSSMRGLCDSPISPRTWVVLTLGLIGRRPLAWLQAQRIRRRAT